jgi:hypothetical protein
VPNVLISMSCMAERPRSMRDLVRSSFVESALLFASRRYDWKSHHGRRLFAGADNRRQPQFLGGRAALLGPREDRLR